MKKIFLLGFVTIVLSGCTTQTTLETQDEQVVIQEDKTVSQTQEQIRPESVDNLSNGFVYSIDGLERIDLQMIEQSRIDTYGDSSDLADISCVDADQYCYTGIGPRGYERSAVKIIELPYGGSFENIVDVLSKNRLTFDNFYHGRIKSGEENDGMTLYTNEMTWEKDGMYYRIYTKNDDLLIMFFNAKFPQGDEDIKINIIKTIAKTVEYDETLHIGLENFSVFQIPLSFENALMRARRNDAHQQEVAPSNKTIYGMFGDTITIDPTVDLLNEWQSALFSCGDTCDRDALARDYVRTTSQICVLDDGLHAYPITLTREEKGIYSYSIFKQGGTLTYPVLIPNQDGLEEYDERYLYEYDCKTNTPTELTRIDDSLFAGEGFDVLFANESDIYLQPREESCVDLCSIDGTLVKYEIANKNFKLLELDQFTSFQGDDISITLYEDALDSFVQRYYSDQVVSDDVLGEKKRRLWDNKEQVSGVLYGTTYIANEQGLYIQGKISPYFNITTLKSMPSTF